MIETLGSLARAAGHDLAETRSGSITQAVPGSFAYDALTLGTPTYTGRSVNPNSALTYNPVYSCVRIISEALAASDLMTYQMLDEARKKPAVSDYRFRLLREEPNREMSSFQWREFGAASLLLWGNWYNFLDWDNRGRLRAIWPLRPEWIIPLRNYDGRLEYHYRPMMPYAIPVPAGVYQDWQILHVPGLGFDGVIGYSPITMMRQGVALGLADEERAGRFAANSAKPAVALMTQGTVKDPDQFKKAWNDAYGGLENTGKVAVLPPQITGIQSFTINPKDAQFLEGRAFQVGEFARAFKVPMWMLGDPSGKTATYASAEQGDLQFGKHCITPWAKRIESKINVSVLGSLDSLVCHHDLEWLFAGDAKTMAEARAIDVNNGIIDRDEARGKIHLNPRGGMSAKQTVQMQIIPLEKAGQVTNSQQAPAADQ